MSSWAATHFTSTSAAGKLRLTGTLLPESYEAAGYDGLYKYNIQCVKTITRDDIFNKLVEGKMYMDRQFLSNPAIVKVAQHACLSKFHFCRQFKQVFGLSPYQYILKKRLMYALLLLQQTNMHLAQAASITGFSDIFTFSKAFKRQFNAAPSKLRSCAG